MEFVLEHININVTNLQRSIDFYGEALGLKEWRRRSPEHGRFEIVFLRDAKSGCSVELTWLRDKEGAYALGDNETHIAFRADNFKAAHDKHSEMGCICYENKEMGIYFIEDPDGYWLEILPEK